MPSFTPADIASWERLYRANFINSLTGFKSASLIGTVSDTGEPNVAIFSSIVHLGSNPPLIGYINRPLTEAANTLPNIEKTGVYTINHIHHSFVQQAHQTSAKYPQHISEFEAVGLTPEYQEGIIAPFVKESRVKYALSLEQIIPIELNGTFLVIGRVISIEIDENILLEDGYLEMDKAGSVCCNGSDGYYTTQLINRFQYAKPGTVAEILK